jgi:hypothetical protein
MMFFILMEGETSGGLLRTILSPCTLIPRAPEFLLDILPSIQPPSPLTIPNILLIGSAPLLVVCNIPLLSHFPLVIPAIVLNRPPFLLVVDLPLRQSALHTVHIPLSLSVLLVATILPSQWHPPRVILTVFQRPWIMLWAVMSIPKIQTSY